MTALQPTTRVVSYSMIHDIISENDARVAAAVPVAGVGLMSLALALDDSAHDTVIAAHAMTVFDEVSALTAQIHDLAYIAAVFLRCWATESGIPPEVIIKDVIHGAALGELPA